MEHNGIMSRTDIPTKADDKTPEPRQNSQTLRIMLPVLLPPLAVYLAVGETNKTFWLNVLLTLCFWFPGMFHAIFVVLRTMRDPRRYRATSVAEKLESPGTS